MLHFVSYCVLFLQLNKWMESADIVAKKEVTEYHESNIGYHIK